MYMAKKNINIYMGVIGEAYVDKENAWSVLLAAKKNILDVQAIINATLSIGRPLSEAIANAQNAINKALAVYNLLKREINNCDAESSIYYKLYALLGDLNENDFDDNFSNGGNIYTAQENYAFAVSQQNEIDDIQRIANELLDANRLNAVIRCKEYNIAKEIFESMVPDQSISPEDLSDEIEGALLKRISEVNNNINYVNAVADEIINISDDVTNRINRIVSGDDEKIVVSNETLYWYAGNIDPRRSDLLVEGLGFKMTVIDGQITYIKQDEDGNDIDFGIDGPLRANKWFHHPYHLVQDGYLTAGVDGGKAKYPYWFVAVPRYILTTVGKTQYDEEVTTAIAAGREDSIVPKAVWAKEHKHGASVTGENFVESLWPAKPTPNDDEHLNDGGLHSYAAFIFDGADTNDNIVDEKFGWEMITTESTPLVLNTIEYDVWRIVRNDYNTTRLNVYMKLGEAQAASEADMDNRIAYYVGAKKPVFGMSSMHKWTTEEANEYNKTLDGAISTSCYKDYDHRCNCAETWTGIEMIENINTGVTEETEVTYGIIRDVNAPSTDESSTGSAYLLSERKYFTVAEVNAYNAQLEGAKANGLEEANEGWYIKEATNGESILPIAEAISVNSKIFYVAIPADLSIFDSEGKDLLANEATSPYTLVYYNMTIDKIKYNVYITGNDEEKFADVINKKGSQEVVPVTDLKYYWYVGVVNPTDPESESENEGNNKWTELASKPTSISVNTGMQTPPAVWYIAIPHSYGFQAYDSTGAAPDQAAYSKSLITVSGIQYDLFTGTGMAIAVNAVFRA